MSRKRFSTLLDEIQDEKAGRAFFRQQDCSDRYGPTPLQKLYTVIQILGYGHVADHMEREARVSETCAFDCISERIVQTHGYRWMKVWTDAAVK